MPKPVGPQPQRPVAVDLFAGVGGLTLGMEMAGFDVACCVEYDPVHAAAHIFNFPMCEVLCADVSTLDADTLRAAVDRGLRRHGRSAGAPIDAIVGGPPCQGFSSIGKRLADDPRNALVAQFVRLILDVRPRVFAMENVPGMAAHGNASVLDAVIRELGAAGYLLSAPAILNAASFGVPQDRKRLFLIGSLDGEPPTPQVTTSMRPKRPSRAGVLAADPSALALGPSVRDAIADLPDADRFSALLNSDEITLSEGDWIAVSSFALTAHGVIRAPGDLSRERRLDPHVLTASMRTRHGPDSLARFAACPPGTREPRSRFYRPHLDGLCNTLRAGTGAERGRHTAARPLHPDLPRVITVREAARLHGMPDWMRPHITKWHGFRQVGNSVCPPVGAAVGRALIHALDACPHLPDGKFDSGDPALLALNPTEAAAKMADH